MKKGQMEILGFLVIILLIIAGVILYLKFADNDSQTSVIQETEINLEVSNMLNAIRQETVCEDIIVDDALKTCIKGGGFECGQDACDIVEEYVVKVPLAYGWEEGKFMFYIDDELLTENECVGNTLVDNAKVSGAEVRLLYCYD